MLALAAASPACSNETRAGLDDALNPAPATASEQSASAHAVTDFGCDLARTLSKSDPGSNLLVSPVSVSMALSIAAAGARGATAEEMDQCLRWTLPRERQLVAQGALSAALSGDEAFDLEVANRLWGQVGFDFHREYLALVRACFGGAVEQVDFIEDPDRARETINEYVEDKTRGKIADLLPPGSVDAMTRLVITNAVYFKGTWKDPFEEDQTAPATFTRTDGAAVEAKLMHRKESYRYAEVDELQVLELPYEGGEVAMLCILPPAGTAPAEVLETLSAERFVEFDAALAERKVDVYLPRFRFSAFAQLKTVLSELGMTRAFDASQADFSGLCDKELHVQAVVHKAFIEVNEEGTEAAAATGVVLGVRMFVETPVFRADHPFLLAIRHADTSALLFLGVVEDPTLE